MTSQPAAFVELTEVSAERALLGAMFEHPDMFAEVAGEIDPAWFGDQLARYMFEKCSELVAEGHTLSTPVIISMLPEDVGGQTRSKLYADIRLAAVPRGQLGGVVATLKDRWARRQLLAAADGIRAEAMTFAADPFVLAQEVVGALDTLNASRADRIDGSLHDAAQSLMSSLEQPAGLRGATTGLRAVDKKLNGYKAGQLYVIAGRPGMGNWR